MLDIYNPEKSNREFDKFFDDKTSQMIAFCNDGYKEIIRDMIINYQLAGSFDIELIIDDIRTINCALSEQIAERSIDEGVTIGHWNSDDDYFQFVVQTADDIIDSVFLGQDIMICIQEMIYETAKEYDLPLLMKRGIFFEYPEILEMFSAKAEVIASLPDTEEVVIHSGHAQGIMFEELMNNEPCFYGRNNILIFDEKEKEKDYKLLEG